MIPFKRLPLGNAEAAAVAEVIMAGTLGPGKKVDELEREFAAYIGSKYAVSVDSCTSALFLALTYRLQFGPHTAFVEIPSMTVPLVANTVIHTGLEPRFVDECDWVGMSYEMRPFGIIDSAHRVARGDYRKYPGAFMCFSFYPTKPITSCEGGMIATDDEDAVKWFRKARFYGRNADATVKNSWEYDIEFPGWKMNMTDVQAAIALCQLRRLDKIDRERQRVVDAYNASFGLKNRSLYLYRVNVERRDEFIRHMSKNGVECGVHFKPLHLMEPFRKYATSPLAKTEQAGMHTVSLPMYDSMSPDEVSTVINLTKEWI